MVESPEHRAARQRADDERATAKTREHPAVRTEPGMRFGEPHIRGVPVDAVVGMLVAGETPATVCDEYDLTHAELIVACWHEARHGAKRRAWAAWLARWEPVLWRGGYDPADVPLPTEDGGDG